MVRFILLFLLVATALLGSAACDDGNEGDADADADADGDGDGDVDGDSDGDVDSGGDAPPPFDGGGDAHLDAAIDASLPEGPGSTPGVDCPNLPPALCDGDAAHCGELVQLDPTNSPTDEDTDGVPYDAALGYVDYPLNGETWESQHRSWLRRDNAMAVQYAAARVACLSADWETGNGMPVGFVFGSSEDGSTPEGHPGGNYADGLDVGMAYYQRDTEDNVQRAVCETVEDGEEAYHCVAPPHLLDPWRTALFIGSMAETGFLRVVGMDGRVGLQVDAAFAELCDGGWIDSAVCAAGVPLAYSATDTSNGFYRYHFHFFHVSTFH